MTVDTIIFPFINSLLRSLAIVIIGLPLTFIITRKLQKWSSSRLSPHAATLVTNSVQYACILLIAITVLNNFGFDLSALLGAAGIIGIALGFAAQTSISNIISGLFLLVDRTFKVGDIIQVSGTHGTIESIDLFAIRLKTPQNTLVRIPNEVLLKNMVANISYYPYLRLDMIVQAPLPVDMNILTDGITAAITSLGSQVKTSQIQIYDTQNGTVSIMVKLLIPTEKTKALFLAFSQHLQEHAQKHNLIIGIKKNLAYFATKDGD